MKGPKPGECLSQRNSRTNMSLSWWKNTESVDFQATWDPSFPGLSIKKCTPHFSEPREMKLQTKLVILASDWKLLNMMEPRTACLLPTNNCKGILQGGGYWESRGWSYSRGSVSRILKTPSTYAWQRKRVGLINIQDFLSSSLIFPCYCFTSKDIYRGQ